MHAPTPKRASQALRATLGQANKNCRGMGINPNYILFRHHSAYRRYVSASHIGAQTLASIVGGWHGGFDTIAHHGMGHHRDRNVSRAMISVRRPGSRDPSSWRNDQHCWCRTLVESSSQNVESFGHHSKHLTRFCVVLRCADDDPI